ncbi:hypothetical protein HK096_001572, partial [Nowakowskiella sp. JEL0078]
MPSSKRRSYRSRSSNILERENFEVDNNEDFVSVIADGAPVCETYFGFIETTFDALLIFQGCRLGITSRVEGRLKELEKNQIRSGSVFVYTEESGIKR